MDSQLPRLTELLLASNQYVSNIDQHSVLEIVKFFEEIVGNMITLEPYYSGKDVFLNFYIFLFQLQLT